MARPAHAVAQADPINNRIRALPCADTRRADRDRAAGTRLAPCAAAAPPSAPSPRPEPASTGIRAPATLAL